MGNFFEDITPYALDWNRDIALGPIGMIGSSIEKVNSSKTNNNLPWWEKAAMGIDRSLDPGGAMDALFRYAGTTVPEGVRDAAVPVLSTVGGIAGSYVPVLGTAAGAAIGAGIGSKIHGDDYTTGFTKSGTAAATAYASSALSGAGNGVSDAAAQSAEDEAVAQMTDEVIQGTADTNASLLNTYGSLDAVPAQYDVTSTLQAGSGIDVSPSALSSGTSFTQPELSYLNSGAPMTQSTPWYKDAFSYDNVEKGLKVANMANSVYQGLVANPNASGSMVARSSTPGSTVDIEQTLGHMKQLGDVDKMSKSSKASLYEDYEIKKKKLPDTLAFASGLKEYAKKKDEIGGL